MASTQLHSFIHRLRHIVRPETTGGSTDAQLLERFVRSRDEAAFEVLVWRHGLLVLNVCRRLLHEEHAIEDAFQATFLALVRKAGSIHKREALAGWLYRVAYRIALAARVGDARRLAHEKQCLDAMAAAGGSDPADEAIRSELRPVLDAAVNGLPQKYRLPIILCYLEGKTYEEAAQQLGCPKGTVAIRLSRGRALLRKRLAPRALTLSASGLAMYLTPNTAPAVVPQGWVRAAVQNAARLAAGQAPATLSGRAVVLAEGVLRSMAVARLKIATALVLAAGILVAGAGLATFRSPAAPPPEARGQAAKPEAEPKQPLKGPERKDAHGDPLPPGALARLGTVRFRHIAHVFDIAFAPDGKSLAAVDYGGVCLWDAATGKELRRIEEGTQGQGLAFSPGGKILATAKEGAMFYWDPVTRKKLRELPLPGGRIQSLVFSPDGKTVAWMTQDNTVRLSDAATGKVLHQWPGPPNVVPSSVSFSPDSRTLAIARQNENDIPLYDTVTGKEVRRLIGPPKTKYLETVYCVAFCPDGKTLVSTARDDKLRFWDAATGKELRQVKHESGAWKLAFSPDGTILATGGRDVRLWEAATGKLLRSCERDDDGHVECLAFSPDGKTVAASRSNSHALSLWDVASGKKRLAFSGHLADVWGLAVSPDGALLASAALEKNYTGRNTVRLWDPVTGKDVGAVGGDLGFVGGLAFSPDGRLLAAGNEDGSIRLWDRATRKEVRRMTAHKNMVGWIGFTADGKVLASVGYHDRVICLWDVATGKKLQRFAGNHPHPNKEIALAPDGKTIVQGGISRPTLVLWDSATGKAVKRFADYGQPVTSIALSPDGRMLASAGNDGVLLWDVASGKQLRRLQNSTSDQWVGFLVFSPDGRTLAYGGGDGSVVRLWEVATGAERCRFVGHRGAIYCGAFSPEGRKFFSGGADTTVLIWDVTGRIAEGRPETIKLSPRELEGLRADLAAADASQAYRALWTLVAAPKQAVSMFQDQLRPVRAADPKRVARLLADLDSDAFAVREQAAKELQQMGESALPALRKALTGQPSLEVRRRVQQVLEPLERLSTKQLYVLRAVEVLEHISSPEARRLLESLAEGIPEARLTREAKASLHRLTHKPAARP